MFLRLSLRRFWILVSVISIAFLLVLYQLLQLQVIRRPTLLHIANAQHELKVRIAPVRGEIMDRMGRKLATSLKVPSVYGVPRLVGKDRKEELVQKVSEILDLDISFVRKRFQKDKAFIWLARKVSFEQADQIRQLKDPGLGILDEYKRFYPQGEFLASVLGFVGIDNQGLEGLEMRLDKALKGREGIRETKRDALGREIRAFEMKEIPAINGQRVYLTIDQYYQYLTERSLDRAYRKWKAKGAAAILMEAKTGKILAMANRPTYNPNFYSKSKAEERRNRSVTDMYEPGSIFKIVAASAALNEEVLKRTTLIDCEQGEYRYGRRILHDVHPYGELTFDQVIIKSSNIGTVKIAAELKPEIFYSYIKKFGFNRLTGIDLPGEANGFIRPPSKWSKTSPYNIPMGHEVLVTLTQMATSFAVIANGGELVKPYVVDRIEDEAGVILYQNKSEERERVLKPEVAKDMQEILVKVVEEGTGKRARIDGIPVGGKTGTAQKVLPNGKGYSHEDFMSSFVGFGPADDPRFVMAIVLDDPGPRYYGGTVAGPVFREVMEAVILSEGYIPKDAEFFNPSEQATDNLPDNLPQPVTA